MRKSVVMAGERPNQAPIRQMPIGAEVQPTGGTHFRVWVTRHRRAAIVLQSNSAAANSSAEEFELTDEGNGYFSGYVEPAVVGSRYRFRLGDDPESYPDPASRFQPEGPFGPSEVVDSRAFAWTDAVWPGASLHGQIIYETHIGTFTPEGSWQAAERQLGELADLGITMLGVMPLADVPGRFNWGYDGVNLFAPNHTYGRPDDVRRFVNSAHALGVAVILDVVYNHLGSVGCFHPRFAPEYFSEKHTSEWGASLNFDGPGAGPVREHVLQNAAYWLREFHFDGLRIDATQAIYDNSRRHILGEITVAARQAAAGRAITIIGESEPQETCMVRPLDRGGHGFDALWNDDFHHSALVRLTGRQQAYFTDYSGAPEEFIAALKWGYLYQGQRYAWQKHPRGTPALDLPAATFVNYLENHDQLANTGFGLRLHQRTNPGRLRAMTTLFLLSPNTPMLFQGQEFAAGSPFLYFADNEGKQAKIIAAGRREFLKQFPNLAEPAAQAALPDPADPNNFERCKLDFADRQRNAAVYRLYRDLLHMRRNDAVFAEQDSSRMHGASLGRDALLLRFLGDDGNDRLLLVNFGPDLTLAIMPQPLLAPPAHATWQIAWSSEAVAYGGEGEMPLERNEVWIVPGEAALVLHPETTGRKR